MEKDEWNCGHCGAPAEGLDIRYDKGEVEHDAYYICVNPICPYYRNTIPNLLH